MRSSPPRQLGARFGTRSIRATGPLLSPRLHRQSVGVPTGGAAFARTAFAFAIACLHYSAGAGVLRFATSSAGLIADQSRSEALTGIIGARRACTVSMI